MWASAGFLVSGLWGLYYSSADKATPVGPIVYALACLTTPAAAVASRLSFPVGLRWIMVANAATYALCGLIVEITREQLNHRK